MVFLFLWLQQIQISKVDALTHTFLKLGQRNTFIMLLQIMRFGNVTFLQVRGSWLHVLEIFLESAPRGRALTCPGSPRGWFCLICSRSGTWQSGEQKAWGEWGQVSLCSILGLISGTGIHEVRAQCIVQPSASSLHPRAPATSTTLLCLFLVSVIFLPTCQCT